MLEFLKQLLVNSVSQRLRRRFSIIPKHIVEDAINDSIADLIEKYDNYQEKSIDDLIRIIFKYSQNRIINIIKKKQIEKMFLDEIVSNLYDNCYNDAFEEWHDLGLNEVINAMDRLKTEEMELIRWHYYDKLTFSQIGAKIGKSGKAVQKQHERLIKKLKRIVPPRNNHAIIELLRKINNVAFCNLNCYYTKDGKAIINKFFESKIHFPAEAERYC